MALLDDMEEKLKYKLLDIDYEKIILLKEIIRETTARIVITSSGRNLGIYPLVEECLVKKDSYLENLIK